MFSISFKKLSCPSVLTLLYVLASQFPSQLLSAPTPPTPGSREFCRLSTFRQESGWNVLYGLLLVLRPQSAWCHGSPGRARPGESPACLSVGSSLQSELSQLATIKLLQFERWLVLVYLDASTCIDCLLDYAHLPKKPRKYTTFYLKICAKFSRNQWVHCQGCHRSGNGQGKKFKVKKKSGNFIWNLGKIDILKESQGKLK